MGKIPVTTTDNYSIGVVNEAVDDLDNKIKELDIKFDKELKNEISKLKWNIYDIDHKLFNNMKEISISYYMTIRNILSIVVVSCICISILSFFLSFIINDAISVVALSFITLSFIVIAIVTTVVSAKIKHSIEKLYDIERLMFNERYYE